jgi:hypothetical protein
MHRIAFLNGRCGLLSSVSVAAILLYAFSIGPACRLARHGVLTVPQLASVYQPILALDFHSPPALQGVLTKYADVCGAREKLDAARDEPFFMRYDVGDFSARFRSRPAWPSFFDEAEGNRIQFREFEACDALVDMIYYEIEDDTWDYVGGRGTIEPDSEMKALLVSQSRRAHAGIDALLAELRRIRSENLPGRDLDLQSILRVRSQRANPSRDEQSLYELESHSAVVDRRPDGHWECDGVRFATFDEMFAHLEHQPREFCRFGILACEAHKARWPVDRKRLETFCQSQGIDLFVFSYDRDRPLYRVRDEIPDKLEWIVRTADSMYAERKPSNDKGAACEINERERRHSK